MDAQFQYGPAQLPTSDDTPAFSCAVRFGRRKADPFGHLILTSTALQFRGGQERDVPWRQVAAVAHINGSVVVSLHHTRRTLHFCCHDAAEAARGAAIAQQLLAAAHPHRVAAFA